jgi:thymidylate synthase (FAD)
VKLYSHDEAGVRLLAYNVRFQDQIENDPLPEILDAHEGAPTALAEIGGRLCYQSFKDVQRNPNVLRTREYGAEYILNILKQGHGSVLEHFSLSFLLENISRIVTHELVRHRAGTAFSQESGRYVRLNELKIVVQPLKIDKLDCAGLFEAGMRAMEHLDTAYQEMVNSIPWDKLDMQEKKTVTSWLRRFLPTAGTTSIMFTANGRALRHIISMRTSLGAEAEIRDVFARVFVLARSHVPALFQDAQLWANGTVTFEYDKV